MRFAAHLTRLPDDWHPEVPDDGSTPEPEWIRLRWPDGLIRKKSWRKPKHPRAAYWAAWRRSKAKRQRDAERLLTMKAL